MNFFKKKVIFLDYASTTPVDQRVLDVMNTWQSENFANPSALYSSAILAKEKVSEAREKIGEVINTRKNEIIFTSGGTEGNNLALFGVFETFKTEGFTPHFVTTTIEHPSILEVFKEIERRGGEVTYVPVSPEGIVKTKDIENAIKENTVLVSVMYANNEIGTVQPIKEIGRMIKSLKKNNLPYFDVDACQAVLYLNTDALRLNVDLMTFDGIKMYGPRGIGMLYVKSGTKISPIHFGGGQEGGLRSGTENVPAIIGFAEAFKIAEKKKEEESVRLTEIRDYAIDSILKTFPKATLNGSKESRLPNNINICFPGLDSEFVVISLDVHGVSASYSSSCQTLKEDSSSYVVESLGKNDCSLSSLRFTLGRESKKSDIDILITALKKIVIK